MIFLDTFQASEPPVTQDYAEKLYRWSDEAFYHLALLTTYRSGLVGVELNQQGFGTFDSGVAPAPTEEVQNFPVEPGQGLLVFSGKASNDRSLVNPNLVRDLEQAAQISGLKVQVTTAVTGHKLHTTSGNISRHTSGNAVDVALINDTAVNVGNPAGANYGDRLLTALIRLGYEHSTSEAGKDKVAIWRSSDHYNHVHISNRNR